MFSDMTNNVVTFTFIDERLQEMPSTLIYDKDINAYKGYVEIENFKFPLLTNLVKLQSLNKQFSCHHEFMFSSNEQSVIRVFLYKENQKIYSDKHKCVRLNEESIYKVLYDNNCDESVLYFDGNNFDYLYHQDKSRSTYLKTILGFCTSVPAKSLYVLVILYKAHTIYSWLSQLFP